MLAQSESSTAHNLACAKAYARTRYPNDERMYLAFVAGAAFSEGMHFWHRQRALVNDSEDPEDEKVIIRTAKNHKKFAIHPDTGKINGLGKDIDDASGNVSSKGDSPLDEAALRKAENFVNPYITDEEAEDEHASIVAAKRFWGERHEGPKGMDAINFLLNERRGYVPAAWHRDDVGDIDLCWGDALAGLKHIIIRRKQEGQNLAHVLRSMDQIIRSGKRNPGKERGGGIVLEDKDGKHHVVLSRPKGAESRYVVTAFKRTAFHR